MSYDCSELNSTQVVLNMIVFSWEKVKIEAVIAELSSGFAPSMCGEAELHRKPNLLFCGCAIVSRIQLITVQAAA
jgi:hypothetical protein